VPRPGATPRALPRPDLAQAQSDDRPEPGTRQQRIFSTWREKRENGQDLSTIAHREPLGVAHIEPVARDRTLDMKVVSWPPSVIGEDRDSGSSQRPAQRASSRSQGGSIPWRARDRPAAFLVRYLSPTSPRRPPACPTVEPTEDPSDFVRPEAENRAAECIGCGCSLVRKANCQRGERAASASRSLGSGGRDRWRTFAPALRRAGLLRSRIRCSRPRHAEPPQCG